MWTGKVRTWKQLHGIQSNLRQTEGDRDTDDIGAVGQVKRTEQSRTLDAELKLRNNEKFLLSYELRNSERLEALA